MHADISDCLRRVLTLVTAPLSQFIPDSVKVSVTMNQKQEPDNFKYAGQAPKEGHYQVVESSKSESGILK